MWTLRRRAARVAVLDADNRLLLLSARDPADPAKGSWWELPGGGIDAGETPAEAAARELHEETGLSAAEISPAVWTHHAEFDFGGYHFDQHESIHVARLGGGGRGSDEPLRPAGLEPLEVDAFTGHRWQPVPDLAAFVAAGERIIPAWLPARLPSVLVCGLPAETIDLGEQSGA